MKKTFFNSTINLVIHGKVTVQKTPKSFTSIPSYDENFYIALNKVDFIGAISFS